MIEATHWDEYDRSYTDSQRLVDIGTNEPQMRSPNAGWARLDMKQELLTCVAFIAIHHIVSGRPSGFEHISWSAIHLSYRRAFALPIRWNSTNKERAMSYISGTSIALTVDCDTGDQTFEIVSCLPSGSSQFPNEPLEADLEIPWYATATGGSVTMTFQPASSGQTLAITPTITGSNVSVTEVSTHCYVISYSGSSEPSCDFEVSNPNNTYTEPKPKLILLPRPQTGPGGL
jgi:hypothetical protein